jgi:protein disulfide isomerase family A protein 3
MILTCSWFFFSKSEVVIYQPPRLQVKLLPTESVLSDSITVDKIRKFIQTDLHGLVGHRTAGNAQDFSAGPSVVVYYKVDYVRDVKGTNYVRNRVIKVAQKLASEGLRVRFAISNLEEFKQELSEYGVEEPAGDAKIVLGRGANKEKFKLDGEYS